MSTPFYASDFIAVLGNALLVCQNKRFTGLGVIDRQINRIISVCPAFQRDLVMQLQQIAVVVAAVQLPDILIKLMAEYQLIIFVVYAKDDILFGIQRRKADIL